MHHGPEFTIVFVFAAILVVGAVIRLISNQIRFPFTIGMLLAGVLVGYLLERFGGDHGVLGLHLPEQGSIISADLIIFVFLPALIFESAFDLDAHIFRRNLGIVSVLAGPAMLITAGLTAALMLYLVPEEWEWGWMAALVFGALISATDPVAVVAILRELGVSKRLGTLIEGESLLNDGTAIVLFTVFVGLLSGDAHGDTGVVSVLLRFVIVVVGGLSVGFLLAWLISQWIGKSFNQPLVEITLTVALAYLTMVVAEGILHVSGVMGLVVAGLWMGSVGRTKISPEVEHFLHKFWQMLAYIANSLIFFLVGVVVSSLIHHVGWTELRLILLGYAGIIGIRFCITFLFLPGLRLVGEPVGGANATVMAWGGLRGAVSLALALIVSQHHGIPEALGQQILVITTGIVVLTIVVNGSTTGLVLKGLGLITPSLGDRLSEASVQSSVLGKIRASVEGMSRSRDLRSVSWGEVLGELSERGERASGRLDQVRQELEGATPEQRLASTWSQVLQVERQAFWEAFGAGMIGGRTVLMLSREIDLHHDRLNRGVVDPPERRAPQESGWFSRLGRRLGLRLGGAEFDRLALLYDLSLGEFYAAEKVLERIKSLEGSDPETLAQVREVYQRYLLAGKQSMEELRTSLPEVSQAIETRLARRIALNQEREEYDHLLHHGVIGETAGGAALDRVESRMRKLMTSARRVPLPDSQQLLREMPLFEGCSDENLQRLANEASEVVLSPGEALFQENDKGDSLFIIARGAVRVERAGELLGVAGGGDILGEMALLTGEPRVASALAVTPVSALRISRESFDRLASEQAELREGIWRAFGAHRLDNFVRADSNFSTLDPELRDAWMEKGVPVTIPPGATQTVSEGSEFLFVVRGTVLHGGQPVAAPAMLRVTPGTAVSTQEEARIILLGPPV